MKQSDCLFLSHTRLTLFNPSLPHTTTPILLQTTIYSHSCTFNASIRHRSSILIPKDVSRVTIRSVSFSLFPSSTIAHSSFPPLVCALVVKPLVVVRDCSDHTINPRLRTLPSLRHSTTALRTALSQWFRVHSSRPPRSLTPHPLVHRHAARAQPPAARLTTRIHLITTSRARCE